MSVDRFVVGGKLMFITESNTNRICSPESICIKMCSKNSTMQCNRVARMVIAVRTFQHRPKSYPWKNSNIIIYSCRWYWRGWWRCDQLTSHSGSSSHKTAITLSTAAIDYRTIETTTPTTVSNRMLDPTTQLIWTNHAISSHCNTIQTKCPTSTGIVRVVPSDTWRRPSPLWKLPVSQFFATVCSVCFVQISQMYVLGHVSVGCLRFDLVKRIRFSHILRWVPLNCHLKHY